LASSKHTRRWGAGGVSRSGVAHSCSSGGGGVAPAPTPPRSGRSSARRPASARQGGAVAGAVAAGEVIPRARAATPEGRPPQHDNHRQQTPMAHGRRQPRRAALPAPHAPLLPIRF